MIRLSNLLDRDCPLIIGHRGAPHLAYENTLDSFTKAIEIKADAIEIDIRQTADQVLVVHHDNAIHNCTRKLCELSYEAALEAARKEGYNLPTLRETLELCADRISLDIELKEQGYESAAYKEVIEFYSTDTFMFKSFADKSVKKLREIDRTLNVGLVLGEVPPISFRSRLNELFPTKRIELCAASFVAAHWILLRFGFLYRMNKIRMPVLVWTVDDMEYIRKLLKLNVAGIISNCPEKVIELLDFDKSCL